MANTQKSLEDNSWHQTMWLPAAAVVYLLICLFDFIIMPVYVAAHNSRVESMILQKVEGKDVVDIADSLIKENQALKQWNPLTLMGAGMFHLAFGALLTGGAVTRGFAKKSEIEGYYRYGAAGYEDRSNYEDQPVDNSSYRPSRSGGYNGRQNQRINQSYQQSSNMSAITSDDPSLRPPRN